MNVFNSVEGLHPRRNAFSAHTYRNDFTAKLGVNIPVYLQEVPPGTRVRVSAFALARLQALISPIMDNLDYYVHFWQLPYRLIENDRFTQFISGEIEPADYDALFATPKDVAEFLLRSIQGYEDDNEKRVEIYQHIVGDGSLFDFIGYDQTCFPSLSYDESDDRFVFTGGNDTDKLNWRGVIAYLMLHLHWYMNENVPYFEGFSDYVDTLVKEQDLLSMCNLIVKVYVDFGTDMYPHGWDKDYFTSGLPNVQFGNPVTLPLAGTAPVSIPVGQMLQMSQSSLDNAVMVTALDGKHFDDTYLNVNAGEDSAKGKIVSNQEDEQGYSNEFPIKSIYGTLGSRLQGSADLSEASAISINELRFANALQKFKERQLRFGRRRLEYYKGFFDVTPEDLRLQVPKYLGGGRIPINITDIEQTSNTSGSQALGHLAGKGTALAAGFAGFTTFCSEETLIIGIAFTMPHPTYARAMSKFKMKTNDIYDYFNPSFEHLGEQAIKNMEVFAGSATPDGDFAYTPRYNEYRFHMNECHGSFKNTLAHWTLARIYDNTPALNPEFVYMQPKVFDRIFAVSGQDPLLVSMIFKQRIIQPVSKYGTPMLLA